MSARLKLGIPREENATGACRQISRYSSKLQLQCSELAAFVGAELGVTLAPALEEGEERFVAAFAGLRLSVHAAGDLEDDAGIRFSTFKTAIGVKRYAGEPNADVVEQFARALACLLGSRLHWRLSVENVVVEGVQRIVAVFASDPNYGRT